MFIYSILRIVSTISILVLTTGIVFAGIEIIEEIDIENDANVIDAQRELKNLRIYPQDCGFWIAFDSDTFNITNKEKLILGFPDEKKEGIVEITLTERTADRGWRNTWIKTDEYPDVRLFKVTRHGLSGGNTDAFQCYNTYENCYVYILRDEKTKSSKVNLPAIKPLPSPYTLKYHLGEKYRYVETISTGLREAKLRIKKPLSMCDRPIEELPVTYKIEIWQSKTVYVHGGHGDPPAPKIGEVSHITEKPSFGISVTNLKPDTMYYLSLMVRADYLKFPELKSHAYSGQPKFFKTEEENVPGAPTLVRRKIITTWASLKRRK